MNQPAVRGGLLVGLSLRRPVTASMALLALVVIGTIAYRDIPVELIPSGFTPPFLYVEIPTLRSAPADVEHRVAVPVEEMLSTVRNVKTLATRIRPNQASFFLEFADATDMDVAYNQVRDRIDRVLPTLDDELGRYFIWKYNPSDEPVMWFAVTFPPEVATSWAIENLVVPRLERLPGVSRVESFGVPDRVIAVEVDDRRADAAGPGIAGIVETLSTDNFAMSAGFVDDGGVRLPLRLTARFRSIDEVTDLPVGGGMRLSDVATVEVEDRAERAIYRVNGVTSVFLAVYKESTANTVDVTRRVKQAVEGTLRSDPRLEGFDYAHFFDQGSVIESSIGNLEETALWGGAFAVIILLFFLRRVGMTLLITLAIPVSLLGTIVVMYFWGRTLNVLSLTGLMLSVGMVVDNAIVVVESIQAQRALGLSPRESAYRGAADVALAIVVATLTTVVVFLPLILMTGSETISFYLSQIGMPVCAGLVSSLVVSLGFLPLAAATLVGDTPARESRIVAFLQRRYAATLRWALARRTDAMVVAVLGFWSMFYPMSQVPRTDQQEPNINDFRVYVNLPSEASWEERVDVMMAFERALWENREALGIENLLVRMGGQWGRPQLRAFLRPPEDRVADRDTIIALATELLPTLPGVESSLDWRNEGGASGALSVRIVGSDSRVLAELAEEAARRLRLVNGVTSVRTESGDDGRREVHFVVDRDRALRLGLSAFVVGGTVDFALRGRELEPYRGPEGPLPIVVQGDTSAVNERTEIRGLRLPSIVPGVTLGDVATDRVVAGYSSIDRENRRTVASITVLSTRDDLEALGQEIDGVLESMPWPRGYAKELGGRFTGIDTDRREQNFAVLLAIVFVFLLMGVLFESIVLPLSIILSVPFAFVGVYWVLWATGTSFDLMAGVGLIILIGIVVNNAIVLVDRIGELRRQGVERTLAIVLAGEQRLRPILMTAATTIFGLVPMALGTSSLVGIPYSPLGRAVIGGLLASTALTLLVVPLFYTVVDDLRVAFIRALLSLLPGRSPVSGARR